MKHCKICAEQIPVHAKICSHCGYPQNRIIRLFEIINKFGVVATLISIGLFYLSIQQYKDSKQERTSAQQALDNANQAAKIANETKIENIRLSDSIIETALQLNLLTKYNLENSYILASESLLAMGGDQLARKRLEANMDSISKLINKRPEDEKEFWNSLKKIFPNRNNNAP
jgi:hypothetical protein